MLSPQHSARACMYKLSRRGEITRFENERVYQKARRRLCRAVSFRFEFKVFRPFSRLPLLACTHCCQPKGLEERVESGEEENEGVASHDERCSVRSVEPYAFLIRPITRLYCGSETARMSLRLPAIIRVRTYRKRSARWFGPSRLMVRPCAA